jgi:hypothetical protein
MFLRCTFLVADLRLPDDGQKSSDTFTLYIVNPAVYLLFGMPAAWWTVKKKILTLIMPRSLPSEYLPLHELSFHSTLYSQDTEIPVRRI